MQIIENRTYIRGVVRHVTRQSDLPQFGTLQLQVQRTAAVGSLPDLLSPRRPDRLTVLVPAADLDKVAPAAGQLVELEVRLTSPDRQMAQAGTLRQLSAGR